MLAGIKNRCQFSCPITPDVTIAHDIIFIFQIERLRNGKQPTRILRTIQSTS